MKTLTLTQPWATLIMLNVKQIETRSWQTAYRGPLAIHAAASFPKWAQEICDTMPFHMALRQYGPFRERGWRGLPIGCVVAVAQLTEIYPTSAKVVSFAATNLSFDSEQGFTGGEITSSFQLPPAEPERSFGDYSPGRFAWRLESIQPLPEPAPAKGALSLWEWTR